MTTRATPTTGNPTVGLRVARAPVICVCGLHGGAGTTTTAVLLALAAAAQSHPGDVALADCDPAGGGLALHLGAASPSGLHDLAASPDAAHPWVDHHGARLIAAAPQLAAPARREQLAATLAELAAVHRLIVLDAGRVASAHAQQMLEHADLVLWSIDATTQLAVAAHTLASPLTRAARHAPWALVAHATGRDGRTPPATMLAATAPELHGLVLVPSLAEAGHRAREDAGGDLLELLG